MIKFGLYLMTEKGYQALLRFIEVVKMDNIAYVVSEKDNNVEDDYFIKISTLCSENKICFFSKKNFIYEKKHEDFKISIGWRWLIKDYSNLIVLHDSLLPKYRGFSPLVNMLINGEKKIGVTALKATNEYDKGGIISQKSIEINYPIKISHAIDLVSPLYGDLLIDLYHMLINDTFNFVKQNDSLATYSLWRDESDYSIDWCESAATIQRFVDAVGYPYKGASSYLNDAKVRIIDVHIISDVYVENRKVQLGKIIFMRNNLPIVICGEGLLEIREIRNDTDRVSMIGNINFRQRFYGEDR